MIAVAVLFLLRQRKQTARKTRKREDEDGMGLRPREPQNTNSYRDSASYPLTSRDDREAFIDRLSASSTMPLAGPQAVMRDPRGQQERQQSPIFTNGNKS